MSGDNGSSFVMFALVLCVAALLYLDWWRQGELQLLSDRLDSLERSTKARRTTKAVKPDDG